MFKYKILKKGRKWLQAVTADDKQYKAQIELNDISANWEVDEIVEFEGIFEKKTSGGYIKVSIYPRSPEQIKDEENRKEVNKWLGYVEENASDRVYEKGVDKLTHLKLSEDQQKRLDDAILKGTINSLKTKANKYLGYIKENLDNHSWYAEGEKRLLGFMKELDDLGVDTNAYTDKLHNLKEFQDKDRKEFLSRYFEIERLSEGSGDSYTMGRIVQSRDGRIGKVIKTWSFFEPDTLSFGFIDAPDGGWLCIARCDTNISKAEQESWDQEQAKIEEDRKQNEIVRQKISAFKKEVRDLFAYVEKNGTYPGSYENPVSVNGIDIYDTTDIYGGGSRITLVESTIYVISNNGMDGDNWGRNNISTGGAGAIGHCMEIDDICQNHIEAIKVYQEEIS